MMALFIPWKDPSQSSTFPDGSIGHAVATLAYSAVILYQAITGPLTQQVKGMEICAHPTCPFCTSPHQNVWP